MTRAIRVMAIAATIGFLAACGGDTPNTPTPTPTPTPVNIAGAYDLTLTASTSCAQNLPAATRVLTYIANIEQTGTLNTLFIISLTGADVVFGQVIISGGIINGNELKFGSFSFNEKTTGGGISFAASGGAVVAPNGTITGTLNGIYQTPSGATCSSSSQQITLVKR